MSYQSKTAGCKRRNNQIVLQPSASIQSILAEALFQIFYSTLVFAPETSPVQKAFETHVPQQVKMLSERETT
jgi:hypothetical protein